VTNPLRQPAISVCIPAYNHARYLRSALESVLAQTRRDFELIVYDDASTDSTAEVAADFAGAGVRYFRQPRNCGISATRNACLEVARGRYIAWLDADDVYLPDMLERQSAMLDRHRGVGLVHGAHHVIDTDGARLPDWPAPFETDTVEHGIAAFAELLLSNYVTAPTVLVRRGCYEQLGGYHLALTRSGEDWDMWMRIALRWDVAYTATPVAQYRQHASSSSAETVASGERLALDIATVDGILRRERALIPDPAGLGRRARAALAVKALVHAGNTFTEGRRREALAAALRALRLAPKLARTHHGPRLLLSIARGDEYANYRHSKALLGRLHGELTGTRFGRKIRKFSVSDPEWERALSSIAATVQREIPAGKRIAVVDKHDPTLLHLSRRDGWHFPDRRLLPGGYPKDSAVAVEHLEQLRRNGAGYLVFPSASFWWLEHYDGLRTHLDTCYERVLVDERCVIYDLK
jgi:glycosyltransferase involved in cell wall biosynthesis